MTVRLSTFRLALALLGLAGLARGADAAKTLELYGGAKVAVELPAGWKLDSGANPDGLVSARIASADDRVSLQITFFPDLEGRMNSASDQRKLLGQVAESYAADSVEKEPKLLPLRPRFGGGYYCVFTDARLVGAAELPAGEYRHATAGLRTSAGWFGLFTLFSQDTDTDDYRAALDLVRNSFVTSAAAPRRRSPNAF